MFMSKTERTLYVLLTRAAEASVDFEKVANFTNISAINELSEVWSSIYLPKTII